MSRLNPDLADTLYKYGAKEYSACYNCGNCTAICSLTDDANIFPRKIIRLSVLGQVEALESSIEPWLCYYCGECSETCPRQAETSRADDVDTKIPDGPVRLDRTRA